jgi:hypothetical protein
MKPKVGAVILAAASFALLNGCVPVTYTKTVSVHRNSAGQITETVVTESITEPHSETKRIEAKPDKMTFDHLK